MCILLHFQHLSIKLLDGMIKSAPGAESNKGLIELLKKVRLMRFITIREFSQHILIQIFFASWPFLRAKADYQIAISWLTVGLAIMGFGPFHE